MLVQEPVELWVVFHKPEEVSVVLPGQGNFWVVFRMRRRLRLFFAWVVFETESGHMKASPKEEIKFQSILHNGGSREGRRATNGHMSR